MRNWYRMTAQAADGDTPAEITVDIMDYIGEWGISAATFAAELRAKAPAQNAKLTLRINSGGGGVFEGLAIANMIAQWPGETVAVVEGLAASIASIIAVSADTVQMPANAYMMIHRPAMFAAGTADDLRTDAELLDRIQTTLVDTYVTRAGEDRRQEIEDAVNAETWLTADDALALGLADTVLESVKAAASVTRRDVLEGAPEDAQEWLVEPEDEEEPEDEAQPEDDDSVDLDAAVAELEASWQARLDAAIAKATERAAECDATLSTVEAERDAAHARIAELEAEAFAAIETKATMAKRVRQLSAGLSMPPESGVGGGASGSYSTLEEAEKALVAQGLTVDQAHAHIHRVSPELVAEYNRRHSN